MTVPPNAGGRGRARRLRIAVYTIALNEARFCERFYASCTGADLVLVADTGSTDGTPDLLRKLGATVPDVVIRPWRFDLARNAALALIPGDIDICVTLDLDELLVPGWREALEAVWAPDVTRFRHKLIWGWKEDGSPGLVYWHDRVHVRHGYRWRYPCHETLQYYGVGSEKFADVPGMTIEHRADPNKSRSQYLPLLELSVRENPTSDRAAFYHGRELASARQWERATAELQRYLALPSAVWPEERSEAMIVLARCYASLGQGEQAGRWILKAVAECPTRREVWCELALAHHRTANWKQCYAACMQALKIEEPNRIYFNEDRVWGALPHDLAADSAYHLGMYREAYDHGRTAAELAPADRRLHGKLQLYAESTTSKNRSRRDEAPTYTVVILSARAANLVPCVRSVLANEPELPPDHIVVVDDGARGKAEQQLPPIRWVEGVKPFNYSRNANLGIREAGTDVILLNDDAQLVTRRGFTRLVQHARARPDVGICSAGIRGVVVNPNQAAGGGRDLRAEESLLAFVCVYIPRSTYELIGPLDERFSGYGFEDNDYCARVLAAGSRLATWDGCTVDHSGELPSTFRTRPDLPELSLRNRQLFREKWGRDAYEAPGRADRTPSGNLRFLCAMRIKNEARQIRQVLSRALLLCQRALVFDDHSTDESVAMCESFGDRVAVFRSPFEGLDEARDKNYLLEKIVDVGPEWVLWIDGDEVLELAGPEQLRSAADGASDVSAYALRIAYVWNDPQHVRMDGLWGQFRRLSFFRLRSQPSGQLHFPATGRGGNLHCGNVPRGLTGGLAHLPVRLQHFGYMTPEQRRAKYAWYTSIDPDNLDEDNYRHLAEIPGARFAPGPPEIVPWMEW